MIKAVAATAVTLWVLSSAAGASAQTGAEGAQLYGNLGYTAFDGGDETDARLNGVTARLGLRQAYFGVEVEGNLGLGNETVEVEGVQVEIGLEHQFAVYLVGFAPLSERVELFARLGYGQVEFEAELLGFKERVQSNTLALGVGGQYFFGAGPNGVRVEYTRLNLDEDGDLGDDSADTFGLSYVRRF